MKHPIILIILLVITVIFVVSTSDTSVTVVVPEPESHAYGVMDMVMTSRETTTAETINERTSNPFVILGLVLLPVIFILVWVLNMSLGTEYLKQKRMFYGKKQHDKKNKGSKNHGGFMSHLPTFDRVWRNHHNNDQQS